jgi:hypothetical protein
MTSPPNTPVPRTSADSVPTQETTAIRPTAILRTDCFPPASRTTHLTAVPTTTREPRCPRTPPSPSHTPASRNPIRGLAHLCESQAPTSARIPGSARTRHRFGDAVGAVTCSRHAKMAAGPRGEEITTECTPYEETKDKIGDWGRHRAVERRETLRSLEQQRERSFWSTRMHPRWRRWRRAGRTSWPDTGPR